jgi:non-specific serine/threonine protein kinase
VLSQPKGAHSTSRGRAIARDANARHDRWRTRASGNLPSDISPLIGRKQEAEQLLSLLGRTRLLTLAGPGGVGKTRLALLVASEVREVYPDGVWFVELASLSTPQAIPHSIAGALDIPERADFSILHAVLDHLRRRCALLILDNCEHMRDACVGITESLLRACPRLQVLTTSREPLGIIGETVWRVSPLSTPGVGKAVSPDHLPEYEAVQLFVDRARRVLAEFELTLENTPAVASLCSRLDGLPLAIELAAARVSALSVEEIEARLEHRFGLLVTGIRAGVQRHWSLQHALDWSYDLLSVDERRLFERLAIFEDGWTLEAAETVCCGAGIKIERVSVLLSSLVDQSLITVDRQTPKALRYRFLETIRQYARERFSSSGDYIGIQWSHAQFFAGLAEAGDPNLHMTYDGAWVQQIEREHENIRAALTWCISTDELDLGLRLARSVVPFWYVRGYMSDAWTWVEPLIMATRDRPPTTLRIDVLTRVGGVLRALAWYSRAQACFSEALNDARALNYLRGESAALDGLGVLASQRGDLETAQSHYQEALALAEGFPLELSAVLIDEGDLAYAEGGLDIARACFERSAHLQREIHNWQGLAVSLARLAKVGVLQGKYEEAHVFCDESVAIRMELGGRRCASISLFVLAHVLFAEGRADEAWPLAKECLLIFSEWGRNRDATRVLELCAAVTAALGQFAHAQRLFAAADSQRRSIGFVSPRCEQEWFERWRSRTRSELSDQAAHGASMMGHNMTLDEAIADVVQTAVDHPEAPDRPRSRFGSSLTAREQEIAALVARGYTNREIAATLVIAPSTAERHVANILGKLSLRTRGQIAVWCVSHGLAETSS